MGAPLESGNTNKCKQENLGGGGTAQGREGFRVVVATTVVYRF